MHVCVIDLAGSGGPLHSYLELVDPLAELGWKHTFVVPEGIDDQLMLRAASACVRTVPRAARGADWRAARVVRSVITGGVDLLHANTTSSARSGLLAALPTRTPLVVHLRNSMLSRGERLFINAVTRLPLTVKLIGVSQVAAHVAGPRVEPMVQILPDAISPLPQRVPGPPGRPTRIGIVANQVRTKGFDVFVDIVEATCDLDVIFDVFGSAGGDPPVNELIRSGRDKLRRLNIEERVVFHGVVPRLRDRLKDLDVMVITSRRESFSRVAAECLRARVPIVAPAIPGLWDTLSGGRYASMYDVGSGYDAARALSSVLDEYEASCAFAEQGQRWAAVAFDPARIACDVDALYTAACERDERALWRPKKGNSLL